MHIEFLIEDSSAERLVSQLIPQLLGPEGETHTWRLHKYRGIGKLPHNLQNAPDPAKRALLDQLPRLLRGYAQTPWVNAVVVLINTDSRACNEVLSEMKAVAQAASPDLNVLFRLAVEEVEAWYLGDQAAISAAYPKIKLDVLSRYVPDMVTGTWELLADAVVAGGSIGIKKTGWPASGNLKHEWAEKITPNLVLDRNLSPSFRKFCEGVRRIAATS